MSEPISTYFTELKQDLTGVLEEARQEGMLREDIALPELAATIMAIIQGGYVLAMPRKTLSRCCRQYMEH